jgi:hypothetical protein
MSNNKRDYTRNKFAAEGLADKLRDWYHRRGLTNVEVWVEEDRPISDFGTRLPSNYSIQSNIRYNVDNIPAGMIE